MDLSNTLFNKPKFRDGVTWNLENSNLEVEYRSQGCDINCQDIANIDSFTKVIEALESGESTVQELKKEHASYSDELEGILLEFDRLGIIEEADLVHESGSMSGEDFYYSRLLPCIESNQYRLGNSALYQKMLDGSVSSNQLIGFALEYYHLVKMSPGLIGPSLGHEVNESVRGQLLKLFIEEYDHDKMMIACLSAVGLDEAAILKRQPLPTSFSAYASLGVYARQHLLSFFSALILFESPSHQFNDVFIEACKKLDLPSGFYKPLVKHSDINEDEQHDAITGNLLKEIQCISLQEQNTILIHITALIEMLHLQDQQIVEYYGKPGCDLLRVFDYA